MQVAPVKPTLKAPGTKRLEPEYDEQFSISLQFWFNLNLRRYTKVAAKRDAAESRGGLDSVLLQMAGPRGLHSSTFQLNLSQF